MKYLQGPLWGFSRLQRNRIWLTSMNNSRHWWFLNCSRQSICFFLLFFHEFFCQISTCRRLEQCSYFHKINADLNVIYFFWYKQNLLGPKFNDKNSHCNVYLLFCKSWDERREIIQSAANFHKTMVANSLVSANIDL